MVDWGVRTTDCAPNPQSTSTIRNSRYLTYLSRLFRLKRFRTPAVPKLGLGCLLLLLCLTAACGKIGEPLPPLILIPSPVVDLAARQQGGEVILSWTLPRLNTDGSTATTLASVEIYRAIREPSPAAGAARAVGDLDLWKVLQTGPAPPGEETKTIRDLLEGRDLSEVLGREFNYAVKVFNLKGQTAGLSNRVSLRLQPAPHPPGAPKPESCRGVYPGFLGAFRHQHRRVSGGLPEWDSASTAPRPREFPPGIPSIRPRLPKPPTGMGRPAWGGSTSTGSGRCWKRLKDAWKAGISEEVSLLHRDVYPPGPPRQLAIVVGREFLNLVLVSQLRSRFGRLPRFPESRPGRLPTPHRHGHPKDFLCRHGPSKGPPLFLSGHGRGPGRKPKRLFECRERYVRIAAGN